MYVLQFTNNCVFLSQPAHAIKSCTYIYTIFYRCKTKVLYKSDVTTKEKMVKKTSPHGAGNSRLVDNESIKMVPLPATTDSQGRVHLNCLVCIRFSLVHGNELN